MHANCLDQLASRYTNSIQVSPDGSPPLTLTLSRTHDRIPYNISQVCVSCLSCLQIIILAVLLFRSHAQETAAVSVLHCHLVNVDFRSNYSLWTWRVANVLVRITLIQSDYYHRRLIIYCHLSGTSGASGSSLKEAQHINKRWTAWLVEHQITQIPKYLNDNICLPCCSLSSLSDVLGALVEKRNHIPYRNSTLTHLLQDAIGNMDLSHHDVECILLCRRRCKDDDAAVHITNCSICWRVTESAWVW